MDILITDVTQMHAGNFCVAGWCHAQKRMIRPLPRGRNWTAELLQRFGVRPGTVLRIAPAGEANGTYPHRTEDTPVSAGRKISAGFSAWLGPNAPTAADSLEDAFGGNLRSNGVSNDVLKGAHIAAGTRCGSLAAIHAFRNRLSFFEDFEKLKAVLNDGRTRYRLPVSSDALRTAWKEGGLAAVRRALPNRDILHVRVGLARPFGDQPDKCYLMLNGVL